MSVSAQSPCDDATASPEQTLGKRLFNEPLLSAGGTLSCASCHRPDAAFTDGRRVSRVYPGDTDGFRNVPSLLDTPTEGVFMRDSRIVGTLADVVRDEIASPLRMAANGQLLLERLWQQDDYVALFQAAYASEPSLPRVIDALSSFIGSVASHAGAIPQAGDASPAAQRGQRLFEGRAACSTCHATRGRRSAQVHTARVEPLEASGKAAATTVPLTYRIALLAHAELFAVGAQDPAAREGHDLGACFYRDCSKSGFLAPSLRYVASTPPFLHDGSADALFEVLSSPSHARHSPLGARLPAAQVNELEAYLDMQRAPAWVSDCAVEARGGALAARRAVW